MGSGAQVSVCMGSVSHIAYGVDDAGGGIYDTLKRAKRILNVFYRNTPKKCLFVYVFWDKY